MKKYRSIIQWEPGEIIGGTYLRFVDDTGKRYQTKRIILVECVAHGNRFECHLDSVKAGHIKTCRGNKPCFEPDLQKERKPKR
jgi:hypothetical protein